MKSGLKRALSILLAIALMLPNFSIAIQAEEVGKAEVIQEANSRSQDAELVLDDSSDDIRALKRTDGYVSNDEIFDEEVNIPVTGVYLDRSELKVKLGDAAVTLNAVVEPENASDSSLQWESSDPEIASIDQGIVTFNTLGTCEITVTAADGTSEIRYGKASKVTGPYLDRNGVALTDGASNGEILVQGGEEFESPCNPMHVFQSENGFCYVAYNATEISKREMPSGFARQPLFINPVQMDEEGWFTSTIVPMKGWTTPKYQ